jgi:uncharacterized protein YcfJ
MTNALRGLRAVTKINEQNGGFEKMGLWEFTKHAVGGGLLTMYAGKKAVNNASRKKMSLQEKNQHIGMLIGGTGGGVVGYYVGEKIANHDRHYSVRERVASTAIGAVSGAVGGAIIGNYLTRQMYGYDSKDDENKKKR